MKLVLSVGHPPHIRAFIVISSHFIPLENCDGLCVCRQKMSQQYSQQVSTALQQWESEAQRAEEQEEKLNVSSTFLVDWFDWSQV